MIPLLILSLRYIVGRRRRLLEFFGLTKDHSDLTVYLSTLFVESGGSRDFRGVARTFSGEATPAYESEVAPIIGTLFDAPLLDDLPDRLRSWLGSKVHWSLRPIRPTVCPSPRDCSSVQPGNAFIVGSPAYNSVADLYAKTCNPFLRFEQTRAPTVIRVVRGPTKGKILDTERGQDDDTALVERVVDEATDHTAIMVAGHGVPGTVGAVHYVADNWEKLHQKSDTRPFAICLLFPSVYRDATAIHRPVVLARFGD